jgi:hypothetical protein
MTDKELEKLFRSKLNNREFAFNPENFAGVERLLAAHKIAWHQTFAFKVAAIAAAATLILGVIVFGGRTSTNDLPTYQPQNTTPLASEKDAIQNPSPKFEVLLKNLQTPGTINRFNPNKFEINLPAINAGLKNKKSNNHNNPIPAVQIASATPPSVTSDTETAVTPASQEIATPAPIASEAPATKAGFDLDATQAIALDEAAAAPEQIPVPITKKQARRLHHQFYIQAGFNIAQGLVGNLPNNQNAASNFMVGATYRYLMNPYWEFQAGLSYNNRGALNNVRITEEKLYSFGAEKLETHYNIQRMSYLEAPFAIRWFPQSKHTIVTGTYAAYLLNTQTEVHYLQHFTNTVEEKIQMESGHTTGINRWDIGLVLGYDYQVTPQLNLGIQTLTGFQDLFDDAAYQHAAFNNGTQVRVLLNYRFW